MPIKLLVTHPGDAAAPDEYVFGQEAVVIGRDPTNLLTLPDPARIVSKHHAEIRETGGGGYEVVDLGSKNFTYLNGQRLPSGQPSSLSAGDRLDIGEFQILFYPEAPAERDYDRTVFAASFVNPFEEPAGKLAEVLGSLRRVYATEAGSHRADALRDALSAAMIGGGDEPDAIVAALLGGGEQAAPPFPGPHRPEPAAWAPEPPRWEPEPPRWEPAPEAGDPFGRTSPGVSPFVPSSDAPPDPFFAPPAPPAYAPSPAPGGTAGPADRLLDVLVETASKLTSIPWQFRREFIGQTVVQSDDAAFLFEKTPAELKAFLLDPQVGAGEAERRAAAIEAATEAAVVHQLAMLDGYKASVQDGAKRLLEEVDPEPVEREVEASSPMYRLPQLRSAAVVERLKETHRELSGEDWSVAERRAFRPAFIKAYLARMTRRRS